MHGKDNSINQSQSERASATTPVGCACGEGKIDWQRILDICRKHHVSG